MSIINGINTRDISVIVQGAVNKKLTPQCLNSIRKYLPKAEVILSTWKESDITDLDYDKLILNDDPGTGRVSFISKNYNTNRQIVSTSRGLSCCTKKYALKIRTDAQIRNVNFIKAFIWAENNLKKRNNLYKFFKKRIVIDSHYTRDPYSSSFFARCFHPSDLWFFGLTTDLSNLFNLPLQNEYSVNINNENYVKRVPEQHIWYEFCKKNGVTAILDHECDLNADAQQITVDTIVNNFFILDHKKCGISFPESIKKLDKKIVEDSIINSERFFELYRQNYDISYKTPIKFRKVAEVLGIKKYCVRTVESWQILKKILILPVYILKIIYKTLLNFHKLRGYFKW